jgi:hypothetical protein
MGVAQCVHYCCDTISEAYFKVPPCDCDEDQDCCKNEVKVVQLVQNGISAQKSEVTKPVLLSLLAVNSVQDLVSISLVNSSLHPGMDVDYKSPPIYLKNRLLLI